MLETQVIAVNLCHKAAVATFETLKQALRPYIGKQIVKKDGSLLTKIRNAMPPLTSDLCVSIYHRPSAYGLSWRVRVCVTDSSSTEYAEAYITPGRINEDGVLVSITKDVPPLRYDYTVEEVLKRRQEIIAAEQTLRECQTALGPFTRY